MLPETPSGQPVLSDIKKKLLAQRLQGKAPGGGRSGIPRRPASSGPAPLSFAQQRLWFLHQLDPGSVAYNLPKVIRVQGRLDPPHLARVLSEIVRRHEILRTTFAEVDGQPRQVVSPARPLPLPEIDLRRLPESERQACLRRLAAEEGSAPFDLERGPLLRARIVTLGEEEHVLLFTLHHIVSDGWSTGVLVRELGALYRAFAAGSSSPLPELPIQYADFADWERRWLQGEVLRTRIAYWKEKLAGVPGLDLPTDRPRAAELDARGERRSFDLTPGLSESLKALARAEGTTVFTVLIAAYKVLLHRYTGQEDFCVGSPIAGRVRIEVEPLIGCFVNTLVLRTDLSGGPAFRKLLARVREAVLGAHDHQELPFEKLIEELAPERRLDVTPLFQAMFSLLGAHGEAIELPGLLLSPLEGESRTAKFDLTLAMIERGGRFAGSLEYRTSLFDAATIERALEHWATLLAGIVADPAARVSDLPLLSDKERRQLLEDGNDTRVERPGAALLHELIAARATATPQAPAASCGAVVMSYAELEARSNRLARHLRRLGVGPEVRVGICLERTLELVVALLAVLKAGGAYVPLDPGHPAERTAMILADAGAAVLVTEERWLDTLPLAIPGTVPTREAPRVCMDRDREAIAAESAAALPRLLGGEAEESLAYVIYTSGSTGRPKGVQLPHRAVVNFLLAMAERPGLGAGDLVPALTTITFDIAGLEIYLPLLVGGRVEVVGREEAGDGVRLAARLTACGATMVQATPATWRLLLDSGWPGDPALKALCGGEALPRDLAQALSTRVGALWNVYGPTETAIWSSAGEVVAGDGPVLLGAPIANTRFYVVDRAFGLVPAGIPGELWIAGHGLARGYLGRPDLTAEMFVSDPFGGETGARAYRTGDLVRRLAGGGLEFLGRIDQQVKVRGYRVELGEIEAALGRHPAVAQAIVLAREDGAGKRLVAYVVAREGEAAAQASALRASLLQSLPEYMVPSAFVPLPVFPVTPSGKIDRRALPAPDFSGHGVETYIPPEGHVEELLAGIWSEVLRVDRVGAEDGFFDLGGHSLLATQVASRIRAAFGVELPLQRFFQTPTVRALARAVESAREEQAGLRLPPLVPIPREELREGIPLSFSQERMWFLQKLDTASTAYVLRAAVRLQGRLDAAALAHSLTALTTRHETLRTVFRSVDGSPVQVVLPPAPFPLARFDLRDLPEALRENELAHLAREESSRSFDLVREPLLRASLVVLHETDHALLLSTHHIVSDGWSWRILISELGRLYGSFSEGEKPDLPPLPIQYADFAIWQRQVYSGEALAAELAWWGSRLNGSPPALLLPADRRRSAGQDFQMVSVAEILPPGLVRELKTLSGRESASLYMTLLAGWNALLARATAQEDVLVGAPIANRNRLETEGLIGFFLNTLLLRTDLSGGPAFQELLARTRETALGAFTHQDMPLEKVLQSVDWERDANRSSPFQIMFLMQNLRRQELTVSGISFSSFRADHHGADLGTAIFEVGLTVTERADEAVTAAFTYNGRLFDETTMVRLLQRYQRLLAAAVSDPGRRLWELDLLSEGERAEILAEGRAPEEGAAFTPVHRRIAASAARTPEGPAVIDGDVTVSYRELEGRANRLARHLRNLGIEPESVVGVALDRSPDLIVALLAILKIGAAYVPLDPGYPAERLGFILDDARAAMLVSTRSVLERLPILADRTLAVVDLDTHAAEIAGCGAESLEVPVAPESLAYLIYTSGSTSKPKGVMVPHGALANYVDAFRDEHALGPADRVLQFASISFDTSAEEIYPCLASGAALVLRSDAMLGLTEDFLRLCDEQGITVLDLPTAFWHGLVARLEESPEPLPPGVRLVVIGGERALPERVAAWRDLARPEARLFNTYGPTEATIVATRADLSSIPLDAAGEVPIGFPVRNASAWVLDPALNLAPPGFDGELWVGGAGVARGYAGRPDLTAERFMPDPWSGRSGARLYRTGDLVRRTSRGLEFVGRMDQQVKIRGFRVELREIEVELAEHPAVAEAVVVAREDRPGDRRLIAYVVPRQGGAAPGQELRRFLLNRLPEFMVPARFVTLKTLPLTPSGKIDRRALPAPGRLERETADHVPPRHLSEETIAAIWRDLLGIDRVGAYDDFFALGGHSLLLPQLLHRLRATFRVEVPLRLLFEQSTLERMALNVEALLIEEIGKEVQNGEAGAPMPRCLVEITPAAPEARPPFFCVHPVAGDVLAFFPLARWLGPDQPFFGLQEPGLEDGCDPLTSIESMAAEYLGAVRRVQPAGPYRLGGWSLGGHVAFEMAQQLRMQGEEVALLSIIDTAPGIPEGAPTNPAHEDEADPSQQLMVVARHFEGLRGVDLGLTLADLAGRPAAEQIRKFVGRVQLAGLMHSEDTFGQIHRFLRVYRAGVRAYRAYRPRPYGGPITLIRASTQASGAPADLGWSAFTSSPVDHREVPGNHVTMFAESNVRVLAEVLRDCLRERSEQPVP